MALGAVRPDSASVAASHVVPLKRQMSYARVVVFHAEISSPAARPVAMSLSTVTFCVVSSARHGTAATTSPFPAPGTRLTAMMFAEATDACTTFSG